ncbi:hypothetical protein [Pseudomonas sp. zfem003]|uniref:hypothetical protein n=1 Tax=Pseudomonas sp. zfem003 TaxID=3078198 RepID=UPI0029276757|nr:hypothetical protein [Pseudomonas sp. zfem003]MDU9398058.1 hypothetical protein [Pseudomonas sp. zfem003]
MTDKFNPEPTVLIQVFQQQGEDPFICAVNGHISLHALLEIEAQMLENPEDKEGLFTYEANYYEGEYGPVGECYHAPGWELSLVEYQEIGHD